jgi:hypothetical protein
MGTIKAIVEAIETRMTALAFTVTEEVFNFDAVPSSIINKAYRIETRQVGSRYDSGNVGNAKDEIVIWIAYTVAPKPRTAWKTALDDRETIETDLINAAGIRALASDPLLTMNGEASTQKQVDETYLVSRLVFMADYLRTIV